MLTIQQKSIHARSSLLFLVALVAFAAAFAARPAAGLAAPEPGDPPQLSFQPASYDFGLQPLNWGSAQANFELRNDGSEPVSTENVEIVGSGSYVFWLGSHYCGWTVLQPGNSCWVQVYFGPQDMADYEASLRVSAEGHSFSAELSGTGGRTAFVPDSELTDFGSTPVGSAGVTREIEITNAGNMPGGLFIAVVAGGAVGSYEILDENCTGFQLVPAATCTLQVRFRPLSEGVKSARLGLFGESDGGTGVMLTGVGSPAVAEASAASDASVTAPGAASSTTIIHRYVRVQKREPRRGKQHRRHKRASVASRIAADLGQHRRGN